MKDGKTPRIKLRVYFTVLVFAVGILFCVTYVYMYKTFSKNGQVHGSFVHPLQSPKRNCSLPPGGYKAWTQGVMTVMEPEISRNCSLIFQGDQDEVKRVQSENKAWNSSHYDKSFDDWVMSGDCEKIKSEFTNNLYTTKEELDFPLAFSISVYDHPQQIYRFLKVIYRPHNLYCLHVDQKADDRMKTITENIGKCLDNVLIPSTHINVIYNCYTVMEAQLVCMKELLKARSESYPWRYMITLCGRELPLRTNREIVHMLKRLNGTSGLKQHKISPAELSYRFTKKFIEGNDNTCHRTNEDIGPVPHGIEIRKSLAYFSLTSEFVNFLLTNHVALDLHEYMKRTTDPDEHYFSSIYWMKGIYVCGITVIAVDRDIFDVKLFSTVIANVENLTR